MSNLLIGGVRDGDLAPESLAGRRFMRLQKRLGMDGMLSVGEPVPELMAVEVSTYLRRYWRFGGVDVCIWVDSNLSDLDALNKLFDNYQPPE